MQGRQSRLVFASQRLETVDPDMVIRGFWVSTALALILTLPSIGIFLGFWYNGASLLIGALIGFGLHFVLLAISEKISLILSNLFD